MTRKGPATFLAMMVMAGLAVATMLALAPAPAFAQDEGRERGGLLRFLFNRGQLQPREDVGPPPRVERRERSERRTQRRSERRGERSRGGGGSQTVRRAAPAAPAAVAKSETAKRILVIGDFVAGGLAEGLEEAYAQSPDVLVIATTNGSSGLVRDDYYDWPGTIGGLIEEHQPDIVIVQLGGNDRQEMSVGGTREQPLSAAWMTEYERRTRLVATEIRDTGTPLVWVGTIPFRFAAMSRDMMAFNEIYKLVAQETGGEFVDVWGGFVDDAGNYTQNGPDMNGQPAQLRAGDGINVTRAGKRKLAFYAERPLNRLLGTAAPAVAAVYGPPIPPGFLSADGEIRAIERTLPVNLGELGTPATSALMGERVLPRIQVNLAVGDRREGRADDFSARQGPAAPVGTDPEPTTALQE